MYLGAAPGVGKTYAMLAEGQRRLSRGTDVVIGLVEPHGRKLTTAMAEGLEQVPRQTLMHNGAAFTEMDIDAVLTRHPQVALVDELAHTNVPGCRNPKRWQDVDELLDAGIDVVTTVNIQHLESLGEVAGAVTGTRQREIIPDEIVRRADQIELVDMTPEALRRRMVHGNVYPPDRIEAALTHYFRPGNLTALRELALLWVADRVEEGLRRYRAEHGIAVPWETRERIVVGVAGEAGDLAVIRRAARIAARTPGSELLVVHVTPDSGLASRGAGELDRQRVLTVSLGGSFREVPGDDAAEALLLVAAAEDATQVVLGASRRGRFRILLGGRSVPTRLARQATHMDVHLVSRPGADRRQRLSAFALAGLRRRRRRTARARAEATALTRLAASVLRGHGDLPALLEELREMFRLDAVSLLERQHDPSRPGSYVIASTGERPPEGPGADVEVPVSGTFTLAGRGRALSTEDTRVLHACAAYLIGALANRRGQEQDSGTAQDTGLRSGPALLTASSRYAREQLAAAQAALDRLISMDGLSGPGEPAALLTTARTAIGRADRVITDVGEFTRLHAGALETYLRPVDLEEIIAASAEDLGPGARQHVTVVTPEDLPDAIADPSLLTRVVTSVLADALNRSPADAPPTLSVTSTADHIQVRVADHGSRPGEADDASSLTMRLARDLAEAMGDTMRYEQTPGGGRTVVVTLPASGPHRSTG